MIRVDYTSTASRFGVEVVDKNTVVSDYLKSKGALMTAQFNFNGTLIAGSALDCTFAELIKRGYANEDETIKLIETAKTDGGLA